MKLLNPSELAHLRQTYKDDATIVNLVDNVNYYMSVRDALKREIAPLREQQFLANYRDDMNGGYRG